MVFDCRVHSVYMFIMASEEESKIFSLNLDPKQRYMLELLAKKSRMTLASTAIMGIERLLAEDEDLMKIFTDTWDVRRIERLKKLAKADRSLLSYKEEKELLNAKN